jgi:hypothetical protein
LVEAAQVETYLPAAAPLRPRRSALPSPGSRTAARPKAPCARFPGGQAPAGGRTDGGCSGWRRRPPPPYVDPAWCEERRLLLDSAAVAAETSGGSGRRRECCCLPRHSLHQQRQRRKQTQRRRESTLAYDLMYVLSAFFLSKGWFNRHGNCWCRDLPGDCRAAKSAMLQCDWRQEMSCSCRNTVSGLQPWGL